MSVVDHPAVHALSAALSAAASGRDAAAITVESLTAHRYGPEPSTGYVVVISDSSPYFVGDDGAARPIAVPATPVMEQELTVEFHRTGGVAGFHDELRLSDLDGSLSVEDAATLRHLLQEAGFASLPEAYSPEHPVADGITYVVTAGVGRRQHTVTVQQGATTPPALGALIGWLLERIPSPFVTIG